VTVVPGYRRYLVGLDIAQHRRERLRHHLG
jgi:hypothetical protein